MIAKDFRKDHGTSKIFGSIANSQLGLIKSIDGVNPIFDLSLLGLNFSIKTWEIWWNVSLLCPDELNYTSFLNLSLSARFTV